MTQISFEQQVVLITGATGGLGRAYAFLFASRGAKLVLHDAGVDPQGAGHNASLAQNLAEAIFANAISPVAATRIFRRDVDAGTLTPEAVAPSVVFLASESCKLNGRVISAVDGRFDLGQYLTNETINLSDKLHPEAILEAFGNDFNA